MNIGDNMEEQKQSRYYQYGKMYRKTKGKEIYKTWKNKYYSKTAIYSHSYYTPEEDRLILAHEITDNELSKKIKHSVKSIQIRRSRLKKKLQDKQIGV